MESPQHLNNRFPYLKKKTTKNPDKNPNQTTPKTQKKMDKKDKKVPFCCFLPFLQHSHEKEIPHYLSVHVLGQVLQFKQQYLCFFIRNGPIFSVSQRKKPGVFFTASTWVPSKVYEVLTGRDVSSTEGHQKIRR